MLLDKTVENHPSLLPFAIRFFQAIMRSVTSGGTEIHLLYEKLVHTYPDDKTRALHHLSTLLNELGQQDRSAIHYTLIHSNLLATLLQYSGDTVSDSPLRL